MILDTREQEELKELDATANVFDPSKYQRKAVKVDETNFILKHIDDSSSDISFKMLIDEVGKKVEWENFPLSLQMNIESDFQTLKAYPLLCINRAVAEQVESVEGLRTKEEYEKAINAAI